LIIEISLFGLVRLEKVARGQPFFCLN